MIISAYIVDTSYICELFDIPGHSSSILRPKILSKIDIAFKSRYRLYVPLPCIFEVGNHIADIESGELRRMKADLLYRTVKQSILDSVPWIITPSVPLENLESFCFRFSEQYQVSGIGLTDTAVIMESQRLKQKYKEYKVHIWTLDRSLKAHEPDTEENPIVN